MMKALWRIGFKDDDGIKQEIDIESNMGIVLLNEKIIMTNDVKIGLPGKITSFQLIKIDNYFLDNLQFMVNDNEE